MVRVPVSYVLRFAGQVIGATRVRCSNAGERVCRLLDHFLNDNSSPETFPSMCPGWIRQEGWGKPSRMKQRSAFSSHNYLFSMQIEHSTDETGQHAIVYASPHPPVRQRCLNGLISDLFYRELFVNPCLSGWDQGEDKSRYMGLCHEVLSRANSMPSWLKDAGIITHQPRGVAGNFQH